MRKLSNDIIKRNSNKNYHSNNNECSGHNKSNSHSNNRKTSNNRALIKQVLSFSSKLFQLKRPSFPIQYITTKANNIKPVNSPKGKAKYTQTCWNTNQTQSNGTQPNTNMNSNTNNNCNKRNDKRGRYFPSPKRFLSLTKDRSQKQTIRNNHNFKTNCNNNKNNSSKNRKKYPIYNTIKESNLKSFQTNNTKYSKSKSKSKSKSNSLTKHRIKYSNNFLSYSNKKNKEQCAFTPNTTQNIKDSKSKDCIFPKTNQNSFLSKVLLQSSNNSSENFHLKEKNKIKVNRKGNTQKAFKRPQSNHTFIKKYSSHLTQKEVNELRTFTHGIYYTDPFEKRKNENIRYTNEMTCTFSYMHCPNFTFIPWPRSNSYKSFNELYLQTDNDDYDDDEGNYNLIQGDHLLYRYEIIQLLGTGSFGEAVRCFDHKTNQTVCIKIIKANPKFYVQARMEIRILEEIREADLDNESNVVKLLSHFIFRSHIVRTIFINSH